MRPHDNRMKSSDFFDAGASSTEAASKRRRDDASRSPEGDADRWQQYRQRNDGRGRDRRDGRDGRDGKDDGGRRRRPSMERQREPARGRSPSPFSRRLALTKGIQGR